MLYRRIRTLRIIPSGKQPPFIQIPVNSQKRYNSNTSTHSSDMTFTKTEESITTKPGVTNSRLDETPVTSSSNTDNVMATKDNPTSLTPPMKQLAKLLKAELAEFDNLISKEESEDHAEFLKESRSMVEFDYKVLMQELPPNSKQIAKDRFEALHAHGEEPGGVKGFSTEKSRKLYKSIRYLKDTVTITPKSYLTPTAVKNQERELQSQDPDSILKHDEEKQKEKQEVTFVKGGLEDASPMTLSGYKIEVSLPKEKKTFLKTENDNIVLLPNLHSAFSVMYEMEHQKPSEVTKNFLYLTEHFCELQDCRENMKYRYKVANRFKNFFETELICHREATASHLLAELRANWDPLIEWFNGTMHVKLRVFEGSIFDVDDPTQYESQHAFMKMVEAGGKYFQLEDLISLRNMVEVCDSFVVGYALFKNHYTVEEALQACMLSDTINSRNHGFVMGEHDYKLALKRYKLSTSKLFQYLTSTPSLMDNN